MPSATNYIYRALRLLNQIRQGQTASTSQNNDGLTMLNALTDAWSAERTTIFSVGTAAYPLVSGTASYLIGTGQTFNAARPVRIERAGILMPNPNGSGTFRLPLQILSEHEYNEIDVKLEASPYPEKIYYDNAWPNGTLYFVPVPTFSGTAPQVELATWTQLQQFADLSTSYTFPPAYDQALAYNLASQMAPIYQQNVPDGELQRIDRLAKDTLDAIRALNSTLAHEDEALRAWRTQEPMNEPSAGPTSALQPMAVAK